MYCALALLQASQEHYLLLLHPLVYSFPAHFLPTFASGIHIRHLKRKEEENCILQIHALIFRSCGNSSFFSPDKNMAR